jgi:hypothetical protein
MSFGNRSNFCSLKEAFPEIQMQPEKIYPSIEKFVEPTPMPQPQPEKVSVVEKTETCIECEYRKKYGPVGTSFNEILNLLLLLLLLYIIIFKPKI